MSVDVVVVGGGVMGAATAWEVARRGTSVLLVEQHAPGHQRGSSHGASRIFRHAYAQVGYVELARRALAGWRELEAETGRELLTLTGAVDHGDPVAVTALQTALGEAAVPCEVLTPSEASARWPGLRFDTTVLFHPAAGRLHADAAVRALHGAAGRRGAEVRLGTAVTSVTEVGGDGGGVRVRLASGEEVTAGAAVVAAGPWASRLLGGVGGLPALRVTVEQPAHFQPTDDAAAWPSFIHHPGALLTMARAAHGVYGLADAEGVKVGFHGVGPEIDPDRAERPIDAAALDDLRRYAETWLPGVMSTRAVPLTCLYTTTPDHDPVIDRSGAVTVLAGFSGHGFKFGPAVAALAADLILDGVAPDPTFALGPRTPRSEEGMPR
ncbi:FAD-dependent oxidoreductase [Iamia sp. SCSIO 61187]|uniref:FAD-dependent oxidoreductase n=1 Tax=Iamia sp. SCSIO 61187 TaxID=2722752 RepID=UPI001C633FC4|nr:FAD-dependent oxidoreductase [Iamia sp. SCSIO 61187]QYG91951.1 FAD-dependent oxidoreductase [Iamia sp. SCSIO 61187]